ncbi:hypothetical protein [Roseobacter sp.]|uniref:hypothetical protein n=1 Tax=Roseobacter sp. TaxID=1907202 RepID=UPI00385BA498
MNDTIGIDVSKANLDAFCLANQEHRQFANDGRGFRALRAWIEIHGSSLIVFEASGAYHR